MCLVDKWAFTISVLIKKSTSSSWFLSESLKKKFQFKKLSYYFHEEKKETNTLKSKELTALHWIHWNTSMLLSTIAKEWLEAFSPKKNILKSPLTHLLSSKSTSVVSSRMLEPILRRRHTSEGRILDTSGTGSQAQLNLDISNKIKNSFTNLIRYSNSPQLWKSHLKSTQKSSIPLKTFASFGMKQSRRWWLNMFTLRRIDETVIFNHRSISSNNHVTFGRVSLSLPNAYLFVDRHNWQPQIVDSTLKNFELLEMIRELIEDEPVLQGMD